MDANGSIIYTVTIDYKYYNLLSVYKWPPECTSCSAKGVGQKTKSDKTERHTKWYYWPQPAPFKFPVSFMHPEFAETLKVWRLIMNLESLLHASWLSHHGQKPKMAFLGVSIFDIIMSTWMNVNLFNLIKLDTMGLICADWPYWPRQ